MLVVDHVKNLVECRRSRIWKLTTCLHEVDNCYHIVSRKSLVGFIFTMFSDEVFFNP